MLLFTNQIFLIRSTTVSFFQSQSLPFSLQIKPRFSPTVPIRIIGGESKWRKIKVLGLDTCIDSPKTTDNDESINAHAPPRRSGSRRRMDTSSSSLFSGGKSSSKQICAICLMTMNATNSYTIFTTQCSHSFHSNCIASNVVHGNRVCTVCGANRKEFPLKNLGSSRVKSGNSGSWPDHDSWMRLHFMASQEPHTNSNIVHKPFVFDDDELVNHCD